jgi:hypothetical protein
MKVLQMRAEGLARAAQRRHVEWIAREWRERLPQARVSASMDEVVVEARELARRRLVEPLLRFAGGLAR